MSKSTAVWPVPASVDHLAPAAGLVEAYDPQAGRTVDEFPGAELLASLDPIQKRFEPGQRCVAAPVSHAFELNTETPERTGTAVVAAFKEWNVGLSDAIDQAIRLVVEQAEIADSGSEKWSGLSLTHPASRYPDRAILLMLA